MAVPNTGEVTVESVVAQFLTWIGARRKPNTLRLYSVRLKPFRAQLGSRAWSTLLPLEIDNYLLAANHFPDGSKKAPDTIRANVIALEQLQKFAANKLSLEDRIINDLEKPIGRWRERLPTEEERAALLQHSSVEFSLVYRSLRICGARPNELARATCADWDRVQGVIGLVDHKTADKSKRPREIPVGDKLIALLEESLQGRTEGYLFLTPRKKPWTSTSLSQTFARVRTAANVDAAVKLYSARHEFGTACSAVHGREAAADQMGHADTKTTRRYDHVKKSTLRANQDALDL